MAQVGLSIIFVCSLGTCFSGDSHRRGLDPEFPHAANYVF